MTLLLGRLREHNAVCLCFTKGHPFPLKSRLVLFENHFSIIQISIHGMSINQFIGILSFFLKEYRI